MNNNEVISILNKLIETSKTGQTAFRNAADNARHSEFRRLFNIFLQQRTQFETELRAEAHRLRGNDPEAAEPEPQRNNTIPFRNTKNAPTIGLRDEATVIAECQSEEEAAVVEYQKALEADLPLDVQYVVKRQYMDIK